jgi:hypothetical protein
VSLIKPNASIGTLLNFKDKKMGIDENNAKLWLTGDIRDIGIMQFKNGAKRIVVSRNDDKAGIF